METPSTNPSTHTHGASTRRKAASIHKSLKGIVPKNNFCIWGERLGNHDYGKRTASDHGGESQNALYGELDFRSLDELRTFSPKVDPYSQHELAASGRVRSQNRRRSMRNSASLPPALPLSEGPMYPSNDTPTPSRKRARVKKSPVPSAPSSSSSSGAFVNTQPRDIASRGRKGTGRSTSSRYSTPNPAPFFPEPVYDTVAPSNTWSVPPVVQGDPEFQFPQSHPGFYYTYPSHDVYGVPIDGLSCTNQQAQFQASRSLPTDTLSPGYIYFQANSPQYDPSNPWKLPVTPSCAHDPGADQYISVYAGAATTHPDPDPSFTLSQRGSPYPPIN